ncbi:MAG TPA: Gfo/Idh/MocA family oxidoreductase [Steroidobacteraceae bacterium]|nr:Gfo/Idh/MocA family oxidoreductase [Steroidobacteraceae bacterium]
MSRGPRVLVVGTGHGCRVHVPALRAAGFEVAALVGNDPERTRRRAALSGVPRAFTDLDGAITQTGATAVAVATPPATHAAVVSAALSRRCHVLCEKPFAMNAGEARMLLAAATQARVVHLLGNQFRMLPERALAARSIAAGLIGEPRLATLVQYAGLLTQAGSRWPHWWSDPAAGGGWLGASGSHSIDQVRSWLGEFSSVSAVLPSVSQQPRAAEDSFILRFSLASGVHGMIQQTGAAWGPHAPMTRVAGTQGSLWLDQGAVWVADRTGTRRLQVPPELELEPMAQSDDPRKQFLHIELPPSRRLCEQWRAAIEGRAGDGVPVATFADGVACMQVIDAIRVSAASGGAVVPIP